MDELSSIRSASPDDAAAIATIFEHYVTNTEVTFELTAPSASQWSARIAEYGTDGHPFLVAQIGDTIAGYAYAGRWRPKPAYDHTVEDSIYLHPDAVGRGLGRALLDELVERSVRAGFETMLAVIADVGLPMSTRLHESAGFEHRGRLERVGFKHGKWIDTLVMQRSLAR